jgi:hypothetical protein
VDPSEEHRDSLKELHSAFFGARVIRSKPWANTAFDDENNHLCLVSGRSRGNHSNKFFTPYLFSRGFFSSLWKTRGGETDASSSLQRIVVSVQGLDDESCQLSPASGRGRGNHSNKFFTPYLFSRGFFSSLWRTRGGETDASSSLQRIVVSVQGLDDESCQLSPASGRGRGNHSNKFFTPYLFSRGFFSSLWRTPGGETGASSSLQRIVVSVQGLDDESCQLSPASGRGRGNHSNEFFTPYLFSRGFFFQPPEDTRRRNRCKKFFTPYSDRGRAL